MGRIGPLHTGQDAMSKILASKDQELEKNRKALTRLVILGGAVTLAILAAILVFTYFG